MGILAVRSFAILAFATAAFAASAQNVVLNPSFEATPSFSSYTTTGNPQSSISSTFGGVTTTATNGTVYALFGFLNGTDGIRQTLTTSTGAYTLGFDLRVLTSQVPNPTQSMTVSFGGTTVFSLVNSLAGGPWVHYDIPVTATSTSTVLNFQSATTFNGVYALDNLSVTPVPEPSAWAVLGFGSLALLRRRRA